MVNMKCPRNVASGGYLGHMTECLVVRLQRDIFGALGHQETGIPLGVV